MKIDHDVGFVTSPDFCIAIDLRTAQIVLGSWSTVQLRLCPEISNQDQQGERSRIQWSALKPAHLSVIM